MSPDDFAADLVRRGDFAAVLVLPSGEFAADLVRRGDFAAVLGLLDGVFAAVLVRRFADPRSRLAFCIGSS